MIRMDNFSLPTQRCFFCFFRGISDKRLFSAYAEVFPWPQVSRPGTPYFSLPTQRCFRTGLSPSRQVGLFSAYAEVFPGRDDRGQRGETFLCLRRGVSMRNASQTSGKTFSLPTQRCFLQDWIHRDYQELFSAYAEVFPAPTTLMSAWPPFLCLRRGVSHPLGHGSGVSFFSLPTQRCF